MNGYDDKCFECDDFFTCDGQCDEVEDEPQTMVYPQVDGITPKRDSQDRATDGLLVEITTA